MLVKAALNSLSSVPQPLLTLLDAETHDAVMNYLHTGKRYQSVKVLKHSTCTKRKNKSAAEEAMPATIDLEYPLVSTT
jgi:hypothetical protein